MPCPSEHIEQVTLINWFRESYPDVLIFAIPNGEYRAISTAIRLKAEGVTPGIPDIFIPQWKLFIEMKKQKGGHVSPDQKCIIAELERVGYTVIIGKGFEDARTKLLKLISN